MSVSEEPALRPLLFLRDCSCGIRSLLSAVHHVQYLRLGHVVQQQENRVLHLEALVRDELFEHVVAELNAAYLLLSRLPFLTNRGARRNDTRISIRMIL